MIPASRARELTEDMKGFVELINSRIFEAAMKGESSTSVGNDYDSRANKYGPEMEMYYKGCYSDPGNKNITKNIFRDMLVASGYETEWCQSSFTIKW